MEEENKNIDSNKRPIIQDDEIDLIEVVKTIWAGRILILKVTAAFFIIGLIIAFGSKVEYEASCKLMPENQEGLKPNMGGLGSLAGLAGINLDMGGTNALTPELYPEIAKSTPFLIDVWKKPIRFEKQDTLVSSYTFFRDLDRPSFLSLVANYTIGLPIQIKSWLSSSEEENIETQTKEQQIITLSKVETEYLEEFRERISVDVDAKSGILTLTTEMPDAQAAAEVAQISIELLTQYLIDYKIEKAKVNFDFVQARFDETKADFENAQKRLAIFNDRNRNVSTAYGNIEYERLQNEYNLAFEVYKGLASQLEQAKLKVKEETPVFTVLEPVQVPVAKSSPRRTLILMLSVFFGLVFGSGLIFIDKHIFKWRK
ncbi:MAG: lipopolysaccharide biosynthesis protein [Cyclobacteriaceae bacterium]|nr:lipopolysaccharide biosynthesis protein [Cyclobacteriaceae bacterium]